jgi:hypothetical protein
MRHLRLVLETFNEPLGPGEIAKVREAYALAASGLGLDRDRRSSHLHHSFFSKRGSMLMRPLTR